MEQTRTTVLCIRLATSYFAGHAADQRSRACFRAAGSILRQELMRLRDQGLLVAGSGHCRACAPCAAQQGGARCEKPSERIYSLESLGVDVVALVKRCFDLELQWDRDHQPAQTISAVGAAFY